MGRSTRSINGSAIDGSLAECSRSGRSTKAIVTIFQQTPLRLFILGTVSSDVCRMLAAAGRGESLLAVSEANILPKCTSLLRVWTGWQTHFLVADHLPKYNKVLRNYQYRICPPLSVPSFSPYIPEQMLVRGKADGKDVSFRVDVESTTFGRQPPFIPTPAAHRLIQDLEDGNSDRSEIARLYRTGSSCTSFVALDDEDYLTRSPDTTESFHTFH
jgi:hypothetical protein